MWTTARDARSEQPCLGVCSFLFSISISFFSHIPQKLALVLFVFSFSFSFLDVISDFFCFCK